MRRLILEASEKELSKVSAEIKAFQKIKSLDLLYFLRQDREEFAAISRIEFKDASSTIEDLLVEGFLVEVQLLEQEKSKTFTVFMRGGPILSSVLDSLGLAGGYLFPPLEIRDGKIKISFLGSAKQVGEFLKKITALGIRYRVVMLTDANFSLDSPLTKLTEKQKEVIIAAYKFGYYDIPRRINSEELAKKLGIVSSTFGEHLRKAERRLLIHILSEA
jgi:predicted DNA binding protein